MFKKYDTAIYILIAFIFSLAIHVVWVYLHIHNPAYIYNGVPIINNNDGYFFASGVQKTLYGVHQYNPLVPSIYDRGLVFISTILASILPFSLDSIILYMPAFFASFIVIAIILIGKLYNNTLWGFLAALLASIAWSYYNRTLAGYYDTDMFALTFPYFILYFLLKAIKTDSLKYIFYAVITISLYEFFYLPGKSVVYALGLAFALYTLYLYYKDRKDLYIKFFILLFIALSKYYVDIFPETILKLILLTIVYFILTKKEFNKKILIYASLATFIYFFISSEALILIYHKAIGYAKIASNDNSLNFYGVLQTVSEASGIPFLPNPHNPYASNVAYRIAGSVIGFFLFIIGYIILVLRNKEFLISLPLVGIGLFAHWGGLRFTVYAVPITALSITYLLFIIAEYINNKKAQLAFVTIATIALLYPNIKHTLEYNPGPVFTKYELNDLAKLKKMANPKDFTLTWWDYGYPIWYYTDTNTLIDGGKHNNDNFIISKIFLSQSPTFAANFSRVAVEEYVNRNRYYKEYEKSGSLANIPKKYIITNKDGDRYIPGYKAPIINTLLRVNQKDQKEPYEFLASLEDKNYPLPKKSRDIYLYAPLKMMNIFLTVSKFGNINLENGKEERRVWFYPGYLAGKKSNILVLTNGLAFDYKRGYLLLNGKELPIEFFIESKINKNGDFEINPQKYPHDGNFVVLYIKNLNKFIVMDKDTFQSNYVQMFLLGNYDKNLFDLVLKSPYCRVYKLKK